MTKLLKAFDDPNQAYASGLHINGEKYTVIQVLDDTIRTKRVRAPIFQKESWSCGLLTFDCVN
jgi:hypothetical protein